MMHDYLLVRLKWVLKMFVDDGRIRCFFLNGSARAWQRLNRTGLYGFEISYCLQFSNMGLVSVGIFSQRLLWNCL